MRKEILTTGIALAISLSTTFISFAGTWQQDNAGWWYQNDDGSSIENQWQWIDGNVDGVSECYYFDENGYLQTNADIMGNRVDSNGAWVIDGVIQTLQTGTPVTDEEKYGYLQKAFWNGIAWEWTNYYIANETELRNNMDIYYEGYDNKEALIQEILALPRNKGTQPAPAPQQTAPPASHGTTPGGIPLTGDPVYDAMILEGEQKTTNDTAKPPMYDVSEDTEGLQWR